MTHYFKHKMRSRKFGAIAGWILLGIIAVIAFALLFGYGIMWLWNWLIPDILGLGTITYWQAVGMFILAKILFGGLGNHSSKKSKGTSGRRCRSRDPQGAKDDFTKWKYYDKFWEEEGESAYNNYLDRIQEKQ